MAKKINIKRQGRFSSNAGMPEVCRLLELEFDNIIKYINNPPEETVRIGTVNTTVNNPTPPGGGGDDIRREPSVTSRIDSLLLGSVTSFISQWKDLSIADLNTAGFLIAQIPSNSVIMFFLVICDAELDGLTNFEIIDDDSNIIIKNNDVDYSVASFNMCSPAISKFPVGKNLFLNNTGTVASGTASVLILYATRTN